MSITVHQGDALEVLRTMPEESVHCCVTSPPYWGLRDYGVAGQMGLEPTPQDWVTAMVEVFREVRRVLRTDGTCWVNLGCNYAGSWGAQGRQGENGQMSGRSIVSARQIAAAQRRDSRTGSLDRTPGFKPKDMVPTHWMFAIAAQADGWWLRQDIIWHKPSPVPESVTDRCTKAHEYLFLLTKGERYWWDQDAIREKTGNELTLDEYSNRIGKAFNGSLETRFGIDKHDGGRSHPNGRNKRSVWTVPASPYSEAHFATYPPNLIKPCILAGCPLGGMVLDPFAGSGTTGMVALELGRKALLIELNPDYVRLIHERTNVTRGLALA